jgi:hypothetical protein
MTARQVKEAIHEIAGQLSALPESKRPAHFRAAVAALPPEARDVAEAFLTVSIVMGNPMNSKKATAGTLPLWEKVTLYGLAGLMLLGMVIYSLAIPNPTAQQEFVFRLILALGAAALGAFLPGFLHIQGRVANFTVRAGGALGMFVLVYLINPPALVEKKAKADATRNDAKATPTPAPSR